VNPEQFGQFKTGQLLAITVRDRQTRAFLPNPLPCAWKLPERLWPTLVAAREKIAELNGAASTLPNPHMLLGSLRRREAIKSSTIEYTTVSPEELLLYEIDAAQKIAGEDASDAREVLNCAEALRIGRDHIRNRKLDLDIIRELHRALLTGTRMAHKGPGQFRQIQVFVGSRFTPPPPGDPLSQCLDNLEEYFASPADSLDPLIRAFIAHYQFEAIHPFEDGNGRIGRVILSLMICSEIGLKEPWIHLSGHFERNRREYYDRLLAVSTHGDWDEWMEFCLEGAIHEAQSATEKCIRLGELRRAYQAALEGLTPRAASINEFLFSYPLFEARTLAGRLRVSYNTARADIDKLVKSGIVSISRTARPQQFRADQIMAIAFPPDD